MAKNLLIVESPAKAKTLKKFLGKDFDIEASFGHIIDLPTRTLGINVDDGFAPEYVPITGKNKVIDKIKKKAASSEAVYLSPDPDREGEAIAWHLQQIISELKDPPKMYRAVFNEITPTAVRKAVDEPRELNKDLFDAQQARRVLDRLVGYKISPILWKKVRRGLSAGRVQSVALRVIVDRDTQIKAFNPSEYWSVGVDFKHAKGTVAAHVSYVDGEKLDISDEATATAVVNRLEKVKDWSIESVEIKDRKRNPMPPFITSTLQQDAARRYRFTAKKTMQVAQSLYEGVELGPDGAVGLITYMRTDSVRISDDALEAGRSYIKDAFGTKYLPKTPRVFKTKKNAQDAHEAIRPSYFERSPAEIKEWLTKDQYNLYSLIWNRFIASQMTPAKFEQTTVHVEADNIKLRASGSVQIFDGFLALYQESKGVDDKEEEEGKLPKTAAGDALKMSEIEPKQHFTQPPPHFTEATLIRHLEEEGIGRPSTYASIISTLTDKLYADRVERRLVATALGQTVAALLVVAFPKIMDIGFTSELESELDRVEDGSIKYADVLSSFYEDFSKALAEADENMPNLKVAGVDAGMDCPKCKSPIRIRIGKSGEFLACSAYPDCDYTSDFERNIDGSVTPVERNAGFEKESFGDCPDCEGGELVAKPTRRGNRFVACTNYPKCKHAEPYTVGVKCPDCEEGQLCEKAGPKKLFYGCSSYPKCRHVAWDKPIDRPCPSCKNPYVVEHKTKSATKIKCPNKECDFSEVVDGDEDVA